MISLLDQYRARVAMQELSIDEAQLGVLAPLDRLNREVSGYRPKINGARWKRLFGNSDEGLPPRGLYIWGGVGRGKTMLMDLFYERSDVERKRRVHFHQFMQEVHQTLHAIRQQQRSGHLWEDADPIAIVCQGIAEQTALLCFDEFQVTDIADAMILGRLFEALLGQGVVIVATSNTQPSDLYRYGLNRDAFLPFIAMLESKLDVVHLAGLTDYRLERIAGESLYVTPLGAAADRRIERLWHELTEGAEQRSRSLQVAGRVLSVARTAGGVARFSFAELCERPLGPPDYIAIATAFHTVIVVDVPELPRTHRNAARRLTNLIDTFYDRKVRLIVSAAAPPDAIYAGTGASIEFARTVSRLNEMCSLAYWQEHRAVAAGSEISLKNAPGSLATATHPG